MEGTKSSEELRKQSKKHARPTVKRKKRSETSAEEEEEEDTADVIHVGPARISRIITACRRCRTKKIKCDKRLPRCSNCLKAGVSECLSLDGTGKVVSRSYVLELEEKVKSLSSRVEEIEKKEQASMSHNIKNFSRPLFMTDDYLSSVKNVEEGSLPEQDFAESNILAFFEYCNVQTPIIHGPFYLNRYFKPLYGSYSDELWSVNSHSKNPLPAEEADQDEISEERRGRCLFFLYIILAIATSSNQQKYPLSVSESYKMKSMKYLDTVWSQKEDDAIGLNKLEMLQSLLLLSQYALMRPSEPSAWYYVGTSCRLCFEIELHKETHDLEIKKYGYQDISFITEMKRRLFWSCFSLDRQVSFYLNKPYIIDMNQIDVKFPSLLDDCQIIPGSLQGGSFRLNITQKQVSLHFIKIRILQGEILSFINDKNNKVEVDRNSDGDVIVDASNVKDSSVKLEQIVKWRSMKHNELNYWFKSLPEMVGNEEFINLIFELNYHQSLLRLYSVSPVNPSVTSVEHYELLYNSGRQVIIIYFKLQRDLKILSFSWAATHILFLGASCYLSSIHNCVKISEGVDLEDLDLKIQVALSILDEMSTISHIPTIAYREKLKSLGASIIKRYERDTQQISRINMPDSVSGLDTQDHMDKFSSSNLASSMMPDNNLYGCESVLTDIHEQENTTVTPYLNNSTNLSDYYNQPVYSPIQNESVINVHIPPIATNSHEIVGPMSAPISSSISAAESSSYFARENFEGDDTSSQEFNSNYHFKY